MASVAVVGGGLTGLAAAWTLERAGVAAVLYDAGDRPGGVVRTERADGFTAELGPNSMLTPEGPAADLLREAGVLGDLVPAAPAARRRYAARRAALVPLPLSPAALLASPLLSLGGKLRVLAEPLVRRAPGAEESVAAFARRRFGREAGALAELAASGVFAGDPERLSLAYAFPRLAALEARHGSLLRAMRRGRRHGAARKTTCAPRAGMDAIPARLAAGVPSLRPAHRLTAIRRRPDGWTLDLATSGGHVEASHDAILLALPAHACRGVALPDELWPLAALGDIRHASVAVLALGFRRGDVAHPLDGFGALVPASEGLATLGVIFSSSLFPDRAPAGHVLLTVLAGGVRQPELATLDDVALEARVLGDLATLLGVSGAPVFRRRARWSEGIPQPELGHGRFLALADDVERSAPTVALAGTWRDGVAVTDALASGIAAAERLAGRMTASRPAAQAAGGVP